MPVKKSPGRPGKSAVILCIAVVAVAIVLGIKWFYSYDSKPATQIEETAGRHIPITKQPVIDYGQLDENDELKTMMQARKEKYGLEKSVNIVAKSDESIKIGDSTISMKEIIDSIHLDRGDIIEKDLELTGDAASRDIADKKQEIYGIYVVQSGDNIWNIHYRFLKSYFEHRGISLSPLSDEPDTTGYSSGVGKILKFSEKMVYIFNLKERKLDTDIHLIYPLSKIIVFNMKEVFSLLDQIDRAHVDRIQFDGETIWIPAEQ